MAGKCKACGLCCKLFYINLSEEEYKSGKYITELGEFGTIEKFGEAKKCGANLLAKKKNNECIYLENNKCSIHADRPQVCRMFFCSTRAKKFQGMVKIIKETKDTL